MSHTPTTAAIVTLSNPRFWDAQQVEDPETVYMDASIQFNGTSGPIGDAVTFPRNALTAAKQTAVRLRVNTLMLASEPTAVALTNANIQIVGMPV